MTELEAINNIKYRMEAACEMVGKGENGKAFEDLEMAIKSLEKQIPKKLKHEVCPNCSTNNDVIIKHLGNPQAHKFVYCWNCGQKLDWSE